MGRHYPKQIISGFPIKAILVPKIRGHGRTTVRKISQAHALSAVAPSTIFQLPRGGPTSLRVMASCVKTLPCYELGLGPDLSEIPNVITTLLADLA